MIRSLLGHRFWIPSYICLVVGMWLPGDWTWVRPAVPVFLGGILFFTCLRIPLGDVADGLRNLPMLRRAGWMTVLKLALLPAIGWAVARLIAPEWAPGVALVCAMPAGLSSVALTDLHRGDRVLALFLIFATSLACPLSIPAIMAVVHPGSAPSPGQMLGQAGYILVQLAIPFTAAQVLRRVAPRAVARGMSWWGPCSILSLLILVLVATAGNQAAWRGWDPVRFLVPLGLVAVASIVTLGLALWLRRLVAPGATTAFACAALYMNNGLAIAYATRFHPGEAHVILPCVLMQVPMVAMVVLWGRWAHTDDPEPAPT